MAEINTETLITAVKIRPALYNKGDPNYYSNKKHKAKLWLEVCNEVFDGWDDFKPQNKVECVHELQRRWKSLRTCFTRELGLQKKERLKRERNEGPFKRRKRYEYFNMMSFLLDPDEENTDNTTRESDDDSSDPLESIKNEPVAYEEANVGNSSRFIRHSFEVEAVAGPGTEPAAATGTIIRPMFEKSENIDDKVLEMLKEVKKDEEDEDRQFMLSLVPSFRKLKAKQKFEARIEILRVLKDITFRDDAETKNNN